MRSGSALAMVVLLLAAGAVLAQAPTDTKPATEAKPAEAKPATAPLMPATGNERADRKALSKACSEQATAKGLHGKERKTFRSECRKNGGKPA
jgi:psiF repeat